LDLVECTLLHIDDDARPQLDLVFVADARVLTLPVVRVVSSVRLPLPIVHEVGGWVVLTSLQDHLGDDLLHFTVVGLDGALSAALLLIRHSEQVQALHVLVVHVLNFLLDVCTY